MNITEYLLDGLGRQHAILLAAGPAIAAAESLIDYLRAAGFGVTYEAQLDEERCTVVVFVVGQYRQVIDRLEAAQIAAQLVDMHDGELVRVHTYDVAVHGQAIPMVIHPGQQIVESQVRP